MTAAAEFASLMHEDATTQRLVRVGGWTVWLLGSTIAVLLLLDRPVPWMHVALNLGAGCMGGASLLLGRWGRKRLAALVLVWGVWCIVSLVATVNGGIRGPNLLNYPVLIVVSGWVLGVRSTLWLVGATGVLFLFFIWGDLNGWMPPARYGNRLAYVAYFSGILGLTAAATLLSRRGYQRNVVEAQRTAQHLAAREAELRKLLRAVEQSPESVVITDLQERIEYVNDAFVRRTGHAREEVLGQPSALWSNNGMAPAEHERLREALARGETWAGELINRRKDGSEVAESVVIAPIRQPDGQLSHYVELKQDITERRRAAAEIHRLAHSDLLTGLPNRLALTKRLEGLQGRPGRPVAQVHALLLLDMDRFTTFNDARGNEMGDRLLRAVARRLDGLLPAQGLLVRVAGDEFAIVLQGLGPDVVHAGRQVLAFADTVLGSLQQPLQLEGDAEGVRMSASLGVTLYPQSGSDGVHDALRRASTALHQAKELGGGRAAFFEQGMAEAAEQRFRTERELRHAIEAEELRLYLQSQVDGEGRVTGAEVLVRWQHPERGLVSPVAFIPVAEESDLIVALGDWVIARACVLLASPPLRERGLRLSVNVSTRQFRDAGFVHRLRAVLEQTGADPARLTLEVTEGLLMDDFDDAAEKMRALVALGVEFSLDDFGTGYSSLAYLKRLPIRELKIDKSFVQDAPTDANDAALVEAILRVADRFGLRVVAEGVESAVQADLLRQWAPGILCQGYWFGRPEPAPDWVRRRGEPQPAGQGVARSEAQGL